VAGGDPVSQQRDGLLSGGLAIPEPSDAHGAPASEDDPMPCCGLTLRRYREMTGLRPLLTHDQDLVTCPGPPLAAAEQWVCESCRRVPWTVLLIVRGQSFTVCVDCASDPDREVRQ
jgi:hypothetical protein